MLVLALMSEVFVAARLSLLREQPVAEGVLLLGRAVVDRCLIDGEPIERVPGSRLGGIAGGEDGTFELITQLRFERGHE